MASVVTIFANPYSPVSFPPRCCYCLEPAATTVPVNVSLQRVRVNRTRTTSITYPVQVPYCAAHAAQTRLLQRYDRWGTVALVVVACGALFVIELIVGKALRALGALVWFSATVFLMAGLAVGAVFLYAGGRWLLQRRYPATVNHIYRRALGISTETRRARRPNDGDALVLAITFILHNDAFANEFATLHGSQAHSTPGP